MAISPVNELNQIISAGNTNSQKTAAKTDSGFRNIMEETSQSIAANQSNTYDSSRIQGTDKNSSEDVKADNTQNKSKLSEQDKKAESYENDSAKVEEKQEKTLAEVDEAAKDMEEAVIEETAKKLGISEEDLLAVMQQLGLTAMDLLKPENVSMLVANVLGDGDLAGLVTDESMLAVVKDINNAVSEITEDIAADFGMDKQTFVDAISRIAKETVALQEAAAGEAEMLQADSPEESISNPIESVNSMNESDTAEEHSSSMENERGTSSDSQSFADRNATPVFTAPTIQNYNAQVVTEAESPLPVLADPREILDQMSAQIRARVTPEITQLQMKLNPENLGTVGLTVSMKEGQMTAQFTTQNEEVRAALEAQITVLKENLEQQGVKIEAVEIMVGSHAFERNLEQGNDSNEQQEEEQEKLRKATRKIDLGGYGLPGEEEDLAEGELVTVDMMQADGNRMDYKV